MDTFRHEVTISPALPEPEHGCLVDGHWGQYGVTRLIEIATEFGFPIDAADAAEVRKYNAGDDDMDPEHVYELADSVEQWLNDNIAAEGSYFGWHDGEFFYSIVDDDDE